MAQTDSGRPEREHVVRRVVAQGQRRHFPCTSRDTGLTTSTSVREASGIPERRRQGPQARLRGLQAVVHTSCERRRLPLLAPADAPDPGRHPFRGPGGHHHRRKRGEEPEERGPQGEGRCGARQGALGVVGGHRRWVRDWLVLQRNPLFVSNIYLLCNTGSASTRNMSSSGRRPPILREIPARRVAPGSAPTSIHPSPSRLDSPTVSTPTRLSPPSVLCQVQMSSMNLAA